MGVIVLKNQPCLDKVTCGSSDARQVYEDGDSFCFSCNTRFDAVEDDEVQPAKPALSLKKKDTFEYIDTPEEIQAYPIRGFADRKIKKPVAEFFGVRVSYDANGNIDTHYYPYIEGENLSYKVRKLPKVFSSVGKFKGLFGKDKFSGGGKRLIITEGEIDAMSVAQASLDRYQVIYPVVSMGAASNTKQLIESREWIRSFGEVVLCFDEDKAGKEAVEEAINIIGIDKVKLTKLPAKDANEVYALEDGSEKLMRCIWDAEQYRPTGILTKEELKARMNDLADEPFVTYPDCMAGIQTKLKGMRLRQIALYISGTGSGKSTLIREVILHLLKVTNERIGIISLEETPGETARSMSSMQLRRNLANEEISKEDLDKGFDEVFESDRVVVLDHQGSINDKSIVDQMEYMALIGCKYLFIDHITILVSEGAAELKGNEAIDKIMNDLLRVVKKHGIHIGLVSHLRKTATGGKSFEEGELPSLDDIKGSGSIKQICMDIIGFARNMRSQDERVRNTILMEALKCRTTGLTGIVEGAVYDFKTGRMTRASMVEDAFEEVEDFEIIPAKTEKEIKPKLVTLPTTGDADAY